MTERCCEHCEDPGLISLLNAAHDIECSGCPWCDYTGRATTLQLGKGDPK